MYCGAALRLQTAEGLQLVCDEECAKSTRLLKL